MSRAFTELPTLPAARLEVVRDRSRHSLAVGGYLDVHRLDFVAHYPDGTKSEPFSHDVVSRRLLDGVVILAHCFGYESKPHVYLRSCLRPAMSRRSEPPVQDGTIWELPAGLVDQGEEPVDAAVRELLEETGLTTTADRMTPLGACTFLVPAILPEMVSFFMVEVDPSAREAPTGDGSALENHAIVLPVPLEDALEHCQRGTIRDAKTELGLRRLAEAVATAGGGCGRWGRAR